jgi:hypothetical protein
MAVITSIAVTRPASTVIAITVRMPSASRSTSPGEPLTSAARIRAGGRRA